MKRENIKKFITRTKTSKSTIYRFYRKNEELWRETILKSNKRLFPIEHAKYFDSEIMFDENKVLRSENQSMRNLIDCLMDKDSLQQTLWYLDWSFFATIAYKLERNKKSCFMMMHAMYDSLISKYGDQTEIRIFFTTEAFTDRKGYHNHLALYISNKNLQENIINDIVEFFSFDRVEFKLYDKYKAGLFYISKEGLVNEDWDLLFNGENQKEIMLVK